MTRHVPVMVREVVELLNPQPGAILVDGTVGSGGHSEALLEKLGGQGRIIGIDRDEQALARTRDRLARFERVELVQGNFSELEEILDRLQVDTADGFLFDLGVSSEQLEEGERGFSFLKEGPLDMRMNPRSGKTAADLVNRLPEEELAKLFREGGEERWARRLARHIAESRQRSLFKNTAELAALITAAIPARARPRKIHPATKAFQALRYAVNEELASLVPALAAALHRSKVGSRITVLSYESHSDGVTKGWFRHLARSCRCPPFLPTCQCEGRPLVRLLTPRPLVPSDEEIALNPRARSAKLRAIEVLENSSRPS
jgi:16S rRNA (cytosine1402-N4)-methyltransferase